MTEEIYKGLVGVVLRRILAQLRKAAKPVARLEVKIDPWDQMLEKYKFTPEYEESRMFGNPDNVNLVLHISDNPEFYGSEASKAASRVAEDLRNYDFEDVLEGLNEDTPGLFLYYLEHPEKAPSFLLKVEKKAKELYNNYKYRKALKGLEHYDDLPF